MRITEEQKDLLQEHIEDLEQLLLSDDINDLLLEIDDAMLYTLDENGKPNEEGVKLCKIYDEIYVSN